MMVYGLYVGKQRQVFEQGELMVSFHCVPIDGDSVLKDGIYSLMGFKTKQRYRKCDYKYREEWNNKYTTTTRSERNDARNQQLRNHCGQETGTRSKNSQKPRRTKQRRTYQQPHTRETRNRDHKRARTNSTTHKIEKKNRQIRSSDYKTAKLKRVTHKTTRANPIDKH